MSKSYTVILLSYLYYILKRMNSSWLYFGLFILLSRIYVYLYLKYEYLNNGTNSLFKPQPHYFDLASKCEVIKMYSGLSVSLVISVILAVRRTSAFTAPSCGEFRR